MKITSEDYIKAVKRANRELEIEMYGKQLSTRKAVVEPSKKVYNRKKQERVRVEY